MSCCKDLECDSSANSGYKSNLPVNCIIEDLKVLLLDAAQDSHIGRLRNGETICLATLNEYEVIAHRQHHICTFKVECKSWNIGQLSI